MVFACKKFFATHRVLIIQRRIKMSDECRGTDSPWREFFMRPTSATNPIQLGTLTINPHNTDGVISGARAVGYGNPPYELAGFCGNSPQGGVGTTFIMKVYGKPYLFVGSITPVGTGKQLAGEYWRVVGFGETLRTNVDPDPGDTGTWGGSQGV
jgi:hypothetical protein